MTTKFPSPGDLFIERYRIDCVIGFGGYGRVYLAQQEGLDRDVALKIVRPPDDADEAEITRFKERFELEARTISALRDPHTVVMHDFGAADDLMYMVLEYIDGKPLDVVLNDGPMSPERVVDVLKQVLQSLGEAHSLGILHRDIKPGNIMLYEHRGTADRVKLLDFGLAKIVGGERGSEVDERDLTAADTLVGTPRYMSPEQIRHEELTPSSDLYSLGLVAIEMLSAQRAIQAQSAMSIVAKHLSPEPLKFKVPTDVPPGLQRIVRQLVEKDPGRRYSSAQEVLDDLESWQRRPLPGLWIGAAAVALAVIASVAVALLGTSPGGEATPVGKAVVTAEAPPATAEIPAPEDAEEAAEPATLGEAVAAVHRAIGHGETGSTVAAETAQNDTPSTPTSRKKKKKKRKGTKQRDRNLVILE